MHTLLSIVKSQNKHENLTYLVLWSILFMAPVLSLYIRSTTDTFFTFHWSEVFAVWMELLFFLGAFLLHNFLIAPLLVYRGKRWSYLALVAVIVAVFTFWQCSHRPDNHPGPAPIEQGPPPRPFEDEAPGLRPLDDRKPPVIMGEHDIVAVIVLILMLGMNLGIKFYFKQRSDQQQLKDLEKQNLEQQLAYLRYQINPHFFMNTLNNIHALVDIDSEMAKDTILELSKLMRFVLYEGNKQLVPLNSELDFLRSYISLMSLRYTDKVKISVDLPTAPAVMVPPLLFVTFVENAFKHGVSYQQQSFVEVSAAIIDGTLSFHCRNSKKTESSERNMENEEKEGGVGLRNVRERLNIIYDSRYTLDISDTPSTYAVELVIPLDNQLKIENDTLSCR